jgi:hypothetical protein
MGIGNVGTTVTITAPAQDWLVLRQSHLAAVLALQEAGEPLGAMAGSMMGMGFAAALKDTASPSIDSLREGEDNETPITVEINKHLFAGVFSSLQSVHDTAEDPDNAGQLSPDVDAAVTRAWLLFKTEAILAGVDN